jgi:hypothetical protein
MILESIIFVAVAFFVLTVACFFGYYPRQAMLSLCRWDRELLLLALPCSTKIKPIDITES